METSPSDSRKAAPEDDQVPLFGTWPRIYGAVIACAVAVMALIALFQGWRF